MSNEELLRIAIMARKNAYAPVSHYKVGAALLAESGTVYIGANVEIPSIIDMNCAERVALQSAFSHGERNFKKIAIVGGKEDSNEIDKTLTPCGACLQFILETCKNVDILCFINGKLEIKKVTDFLTVPYEFQNR